MIVFAMRRRTRFFREICRDAQKRESFASQRWRLAWAYRRFSQVQSVPFTDEVAGSPQFRSGRHEITPPPPPAPLPEPVDPVDPVDKLQARLKRLHLPADLFADLLSEHACRRSGPWAHCLPAAPAIRK